MDWLKITNDSQNLMLDVSWGLRAIANHLKYTLGDIPLLKTLQALADILKDQSKLLIEATNYKVFEDAKRADESSANMINGMLTMINMNKRES